VHLAQARADLRRAAREGNRVHTADRFDHIRHLKKLLQIFSG
jgi:hypothetical protein